MINELQKILRPPKRHPINENVWLDFESKERIELPKDFKEFITIYGSGVVDDFVWVLNPLSNNPNLNFEKSRYFQDSYRVMHKDFPSDYPRPIYPAQGSFIPWAVTDNGETFIWIVDGGPNRWRAAVHSVDQGNEEIYDFGCVEFLFRILRREVSSKILPIQFPSIGLERHVFKAVD